MFEEVAAIFHDKAIFDPTRNGLRGWKRKAMLVEAISVRLWYLACDFVRTRLRIRASRGFGVPNPEENT
jgi:hypothetical protein